MGRLCIFLLMTMALCFPASGKSFRKSAYADITLYDHIQSKCKRSCVDQETLLTSVTQAVHKTAIDFRIILAIIQVESAFNPKAKNGPNVGLNQINLRYHRKKFSGKDYFDVRDNISVGTSIFKDCHDRMKGNLQKSLQCYNGFPHGDPNYVKKVMAAYREIEKLIDLDRRSLVVRQEDV